MTRKRKEGLIYPRDKNAIIKMMGGMCFGCSNKDRLVVDHIVPRSHGGSDELSNLQPLCSRCDRRKKDRTIDFRNGTPDWWIETEYKGCEVISGEFKCHRKARYPFNSEPKYCQFHAVEMNLL